jgi:hypothetical protein
MESYPCATCNSTKRPGKFKQDVLPSWTDPVGRLQVKTENLAGGA